MNTDFFHYSCLC